VNPCNVVVTGMGLVTAVGLDTASTWSAVKAGQGGVGIIESLNPDDFSVKFAAEVKGFDPNKFMDPKDARKADRYSQMAIAAATEAMAQSGLGELEEDESYRAGCIIASGIGGMLTFEDQHEKFVRRGQRGVSPLFIPMMIADMAAGLVSIRFGLRGPNYCTTSACASAGHAIASACDQIRLGAADVMIAGGSEAAVCPMALSGFGNMKALSTRNDDPATASRPFDAERDGFVLGEGAGILVLESEEHARARGATILGRIIGYGSTADAFHMTQPANEGHGAENSMRLAMSVAGIEPEQVGYINAHGTSTPFNDKIETLAIRTVFGAHAERLKISSTKSMVGHLLGAAGAVEAAVTILALRDGILPPTINLTNPDPECDLDYIAGGAVEQAVDYALSNSFGFGGHNVTLCFGAVG
jgi:3-oxoacyl-[acyl-carrier-protein] synthase II